MIRNITELKGGEVLHADVAVVGAGFAGIDMARYLGRRGLRVVLLESGRLEFDADIQALTRVAFAGKPLRTHETDGHISPYLPPMYRGYCRIRQFGGTTNVWTGKWRIFDPWDFDKRPWISHSGWPIKIDDLMPFYEETARDYGFGDFTAESHPELVREARKQLTPVGLEPHLFYLEKETTRPGQRFFQELKKASSIDIVLGANATEIVLDDDLEHVREIVFQSLDKRRFTVSAAHFVLATGGLEVPRLLLASNRQIPAGVGNARDFVGRFYMDHPKHMQGKLKPGLAFKRIYGVPTQRRPRFGMSFSLSGDVQRTRSLLNHAIFLNPVYRYSRDRVSKNVEAIGTALNKSDVRRLLAPCLALVASPRAFDCYKALQQWVYGNCGAPVTHFAVKLALEQAPNRDSRVYLGPQRDTLGMPQLVVDWRFTHLDHDSLDALVPILKTAFVEVGLGCLDFGPAPLSLDEMMDASHHMGTTRMASGPSEGVVDVNCRVFGTDNLFIASSSVFPIGHAYSPTYTILAVARRVGAHILGLYSRAGRGVGSSVARAEAS
ncbi:MAG: GMC oxidoreductase [Pyrinomonadaceae bacterium]